ncbi:MAG: transketolase, partial [Synergistaceae bacterium]|nr:transketolase [Synergistaceae bacterium]
MTLPNIHKFPKEKLSPEEISALETSAKSARISALTMISAAKSGHPAGAFSSMEMFMTVYGVADLTPENCSGVKRDYVVISHGHTSAGVYAALSEWGFFDKNEAMAHFRQAGSVFQGHVEREVHGVDLGTGNLGQGLSAGVGFALAQRANNHNGRVYVLMGDGGQTKGQISEARRMAVSQNLTGLVALIDWND